MFYIKWRRNSFGQMGPMLVHPDGTMVLDQNKVVVEHDPEGLTFVTVKFRVGGDTIKVWDPPETGNE